MKNSNATTRTAISAAALAAAALTATPVIADVEFNLWNGYAAFHHKRTGVPDMDQKRYGLPNNGNCYCVPTSAMNLLMYIASHGYPQVTPGPGYWGGPATFDEVTGLLLTLGTGAGISPGGPDPNDPDCDDGGLAGDGSDGECTTLSCGGSMKKVYEEILDLDWFGSAESQLVFTARFLDDNAPPVNFDNLAQLGISGNVVCFAFGRYTPVGAVQGQTIYRRTGGHQVTMNEAYSNGFQRELYVRDPAETNGDIHVQSPYVTKMYTITNETILVTNDPPGGILQNWEQKSLSGLNEPHNDGKKRLIDSYFAARPKFGTFWTGLGIGNILLGPAIGGGAGDTLFPILGWPTPLDLVQDEMQLGWYALMPGPVGAVGSLVHIDPFAPTPTVAVQTLNSTNATQLVLGRKSTLYTITPSSGLLEHYNCFGERLDALPLIPGYAALAYDDESDTVLALRPHIAGADGRIAMIPASLDPDEAPTVVMSLPAGVEATPDSRIAINPTNGHMWVSSKSVGKAYGLMPSAASPLQLVVVDSIGGFDSLTGIEFDDSGRLFVVDDGQVKVFEPGQAGWQPGHAGALEGVEVGSTIRIARSRTNFDPAIHDTELWDNVDIDELVDIGESLPDCLGDLDGNGVVDGADLGMLLNAWNGGGIADLNGDGVVDGADLGILLNAWGGCGG